MEASDSLGMAIEEALRHARSVEKLMGVIERAKNVSEALHALAEFDPELAPEILEAMGHVGDTIAALERTFEFLNARYDVALARARGGE